MKYILRDVFNFFVAAATTAPHTVAPEWESPWPHPTMLVTRNGSQNVAVTRKLRKFKPVMKYVYTPVMAFVEFAISPLDLGSQVMTNERAAISDMHASAPTLD